MTTTLEVRDLKVAIGAANVLRGVSLELAAGELDAAVVGATVTATNVDTNVSVSTATVSDGRYVLAQVPTGRYTITCEAPGFRKFTRSGLEDTLRQMEEEPPEFSAQVLDFLHGLPNYLWLDRGKLVAAHGG